MESFPSHLRSTNAEIIDINDVARRQQATEIADNADGLPTREQAGADIIDISSRLDGRTQRAMGQTKAEVQTETAHKENFTDPDSGLVKDLDRTELGVVTRAQEAVDSLGIKADVDTEKVRSAVVAAGQGEDIRGLQSKATEKRDDDVITDETESTIEARAVLETVKEILDDSAEIYSLSQRLQDRLGRMSVADVVGMQQEQVASLSRELETPATDEIIGTSTDGEEQRFEHTTESGPFLMNVLNGRTQEAMKDLTEDGREQLSARIEDYQDKYGVNHLSDARLEVRDLQRLERIFLRNNKNIRVAQAYQDKQYEPENVLAA